MHVKRLYRPTVREALMAAKEELGPDALVLSTELVPAPGWRGWVGQRVVRLTAAAERPVSEDRLLETERRPAQRGGPREGLVAKLTAAGLDETFSDAVVERLSDADCRGASGRAILRAVASELEPIAGADPEYARYEVFVGPPGAGKTTTIAKIAAQERAAGGAPLALVAADGFRAGAVEQLRTYAAIVGMPFRPARSSEELDEALSAARRTALVDTAGRSPSDSELASLFDVLNRKRSVRIHLVLAGDTSAASARRLLDRYAPLRPARVVITKLDECESIMPLVTVVRERLLPVSYLTAGQRVPEDLTRATPAALAAALLGETLPEAAA
jgi:flagellar biosynthesis protein FlhF